MRAILSPCSITLPSECGISRKPNFVTENEGCASPLTEGEVRAFDGKTLVFDVVYVVSKEELVIICPPPMNLEYLYEDMVVGVRDAKGRVRRLPLKERNRAFLGVFVYSSDGLQISSETEISLGFGDFDCVVVAPRMAAADKRGLLLTTLQKDNPINWIVDWIRYYNHLGVDHFRIYDNNSVYQEDLVRHLHECLPPEIDVEVFAWNFPYGPINYPLLKFCQIAQLNHSMFDHPEVEWIINLDVDEYLVLPSEFSSFKPWLSSFAGNVGLISIPGRISDKIGVGLVDERVTVRDFRYVRIEPQIGGNKYVARRSAIRNLLIHGAAIDKVHKQVSVPFEEAHFIHYKSLTNGWKNVQQPLRAQTIRFNPTRHTTCDTVIKTFEVIDRKGWLGKFGRWRNWIPRLRAATMSPRIRRIRRPDESAAPAPRRWRRRWLWLS